MPKPARRTAPKSKRPAPSKQPAAAPATKPPTLSETFKALEKILALYSPPLKLWVAGTKSKPTARLTIPIAVTIPGIYSGKPIELEVASLVPVKAAIALHFLPLYIKPALKSKISPTLLKSLKGKTCFHINSLAPPLLEDVRQAIDVGTQLYRDRGWL